MKKSKLLGVALIGTLISIAGFVSCEKTYVEPIASTTSLKNPSLVIAPAGWRIVSFQWHDKSDNNHFIDYFFQFNADGSITAIHNHVTEYGKWSLKNNTIVELSFSIEPLNELSNNWTIVSHSVDNIELRGLYSDDNSTEFLSLIKGSLNTEEK